MGLLLAVGLTLVLGGCAKAAKPGTTFTSQCLIPADQGGTIEGKWDYSPIPVALKQLPGDPSNFTAGEISAITAAADTWNSFFGKSKGFPILNIAAGAVKTVITPSQAQIYSACNAPIVTSSGFGASPQSGGQDSVLIHKIVGSWNIPSVASGTSELIAVTGLCTLDGTEGSNSVFKYAWMEINEVDFFRAGTQQPDLQSIVTHEFGHLLGLNHSCSSNGLAGFPACGTVGGYDAAVMYPTVNFSNGNGEVRRALTLNDQSRANCLY